METKKEQNIKKIFDSTRSWVFENDYQGGCHFISAAMYVLLSESKVDCKLCIGEVQTGEKFFDHSWIEIDDKVYDVAVANPLPGATKHPLVYGSIDAKTKEETTLGYGVPSGEGLDADAIVASSRNLEEYSKEGGDQLWKITKIIGKKCKIKMVVGTIRNKYGEVERTMIVRT